MRVAIAGGNGGIGRQLTAQLISSGHDVVWLSHRPGRVAPMPPKARPVAEAAFVPDTIAGPWADEVSRADAVVNLSGFPIVARWTDHSKALIESSRIDSTRAIVDAMARARAAGAGPTVLVNGSAVGYYGDCGDRILDEDAPVGKDWLAQVCLRWESEARRAEGPGTRVVRVRTGIVLSDEGALTRVAPPMRMFVGGPIGSGRQWISWVHAEDIAGLFRHAVENPAVEGAINGGAPVPLRYSEFSREIGRALHRPSWLPVPRAALRLILGEGADSLLMSQRMDAGKALRTGYVFRFPEVATALAEVFGG